MEHQEFLPRAVARFHGRRRSGFANGVRQTSAARAGASLGMSRTFPPATSWAAP